MAQHPPLENQSAGRDQATAPTDAAYSAPLDQVRHDTFLKKGDTAATRTGDTNVQFLDTSGLNDHFGGSGDNLQNQKARLDRYAAAHPQEGEGLRADLKALEERMQGRPDGERQTREVLKSVNSLLEAGDKATLSPRENREAVAAQILKHSAHPEAINQGLFNSCNLATMETEVYTRQPAKAAALVASTALTGKYEADDGTKGKLDSGTINHWAKEFPAGAQDLEDKVPPRDHASQIFQAVAFNVKLDNGESQYQFSLKPATEFSPSGETVIDPKHPGENQIYKQLPNSYDYPSVYKRLTGQDSNGVVTLEDANNGEQLQAHLQKLKSEGHLPVAIAVNSLSQPVKDAVGENAANSAAISGVGAHMMTVTDISEDGTVKYRNHLNGQQESSADSQEMYTYLTYPKLPEKGLNDLVAKVHESVPNSKLHSAGVFTMLKQLHPEQRPEFMAKFEQTSGKNLYEMLSDKDKEALGVNKPWYKPW